MSIEQEMKAFNYKQIFTALSKLSSRIIHNVQNAATHLVNPAITMNLEQDQTLQPGQVTPSGRALNPKSHNEGMIETTIADSLEHAQAQKLADQKVTQMKKSPQKIDEPKSTLPTPNSR